MHKKNITPKKENPQAQLLRDKNLVSAEHIEVENVTIEQPTFTLLAKGNTYLCVVNFEERISTNGKVIKKSDDEFIIQPCDGKEFSGKERNTLTMFGYGKKLQQLQIGKIVDATIDGKSYQGSEIIVKGKNVYVEGQIVNNQIESSTKVITRH